MNSLGSKKNRRRNSGRHVDKKIDISQNTSFLILALLFISLAKLYLCGLHQLSRLQNVTVRLILQSLQTLAFFGFVIELFFSTENFTLTHRRLVDSFVW